MSTIFIQVLRSQAMLQKPEVFSRETISLKLAQTTPLAARNNMVNPTNLLCVWGRAALKEFKRSLFLHMYLYLGLFFLKKKYMWV